MRTQTAMMLGACLTAGVCAGAVAGLDAARNVDAVYTAPRPVRYAALPPMPASSSWDWNETPIAAAPPALPEQAGAAERAFFDTDLTYAAAAGPVEQAVVRVHRPRRVAEPVLTADEPAIAPEEALPETEQIGSDAAPTT